MLISLKQLVTVSHRVNDQQPSSSQRTWFIAWLTILGLSHANLKIGATYLSKLRIMERIYFVYSSILKSHQIGEPMCLINLIRASLVKLIRSVAKPPIECCECQSRIYPFQWEMNEWIPSLWWQLSELKHPLQPLHHCQCYHVGELQYRAQHWVMSSSTPIMWTDIYMTPLSLFPPSRSTHAVARIWSWSRPKKEDWLKKKDRNQRRPGCRRKKL